MTDTDSDLKWYYWEKRESWEGMDQNIVALEIKSYNEKMGHNWSIIKLLSRITKWGKLDRVVGAVIMIEVVASNVPAVATYGQY